MLTLYFSGTGNSKFVAERFALGMGGACHSIEEDADFSSLIRAADTVAFVYPIYLSRPPRIMSEFVAARRDDLQGKKLVILCTQMVFSGDGARCLTDHLPKDGCRVVYAEHIIMPNNVNNMWCFPHQSPAKVRKLACKARKKVDAICEDIKAGRVVRRGFHAVSRLLGLLQGGFSPNFERMMLNSVRIGGECNGCGLCVRRCPTHNLTLVNGKAAAGGSCTECYRCINLCPRRAIGIYFKGRVKWQYQGIVDKD